jgi:hypothetical protein
MDDRIKILVLSAPFLIQFSCEWIERDNNGQLIDGLTFSFIHGTFKEGGDYRVGFSDGQRGQLRLAFTANTFLKNFILCQHTAKTNKLGA